MSYITIAVTGIIVMFVISIIYISINKRQEYNLIEDISTININKEDLEKHAIEISNFYSDTNGKNYRRRLMNSLDASYRKILEAYNYIDKDVKNNLEVDQAAEWLLDNLYLIEKEYKNIKNNMPRKYYNKLPIISKGIMRGYPRIYHIAIEIVSYTRGKIDEDIIERFINKYQENIVLTSGELWALPIMFRIALIQNISKITEKIIYSQREKNLADEIVNKIINLNEYGDIKESINNLIERDKILTSGFVERFIKELRDNAIDNTTIYEWIDKRLERQETNTEKMINIEHQKQSNFQISIGNCVTGIREVEALNWKKNFEKLSYVEKILREDPSGIYENMDFESKDYYRHELEKLSKYMNMSESFVAKKAIECAKEFKVQSNKEYFKHVGYYIIDDGIKYLKDKVQFKDKIFGKIKNKIIKNGIMWYIGSIIFGTIALISLIVYVSLYNDSNPIFWKYIFGILVALVPCSEIIISIFNWSISNLTNPRFVPKMNFEDKIPDEFSTIVVIPALINNKKEAVNLINDMEVYYLANNQKNIYYALLGDFKDSDKEKEDKDYEIIENALRKIKDLNKKYCEDGKEIFYFFNRYRQYNKKENKWLGWERKRGKLVEFNKLIKGNKNTSYDVISGDINNLSKAKYIITLDADTQLPRDSAKKLIGAMAHILNKPYIDYENKIVKRGYGLMQPRISVGSISANKTIFSKIFSGEIGIDTYTTAISDVYQDLFGEGIFTGKGIYNIDVFNYILHNEIPENSVLSHDLLEGSYVRTALVTDIELIDGYPAYYNSSCKRLHRWVRGDWQLLPWINKKCSLNKLSKWKILDNLRRSLLSVSIIILVILSFGIFSRIDIWLITAFISLVFPILFDMSDTMVSPIKGIGISGKVKNFKSTIEQFFLIVCFLPYQAYLMLDAIFRSLYRVYISKNKLLEWQTAADIEAKSGKKIVDYIRLMWSGSIISIFILFLSINRSINWGLLMLPTCLIWFISPFIAYYISKEDIKYTAELSYDEKKLLQIISRKTWAYFEDFVGEDTNWLGPDNYQEDPYNGIAHRTSPTNMGMALTSNIVAFDLGYIGILEFLNRIDNTVTNMEQLPKFKGHYFNWYNTKTKEPLKPRYISTVDSGNLVGYLWLLSETLEQYFQSSFISKKNGFCDILVLGNQELEKEIGVTDFYASAIYFYENMNLDVLSWNKLLLDICDKIKKIEKKKDIKNLYWNNKVKDMAYKFLKELQKVVPFLNILLECFQKEKNIYNDLKKIFFKKPIKELPKELENIYNNLDLILLKNDEEKKEIEKLKQYLIKSKSEIEKIINKKDNLKTRINSIAEGTDFNILYDKKRELFSIGYDMEKETLGKSYYDLLASESRQASFIAIAKGDINQNHWFKLGRAITSANKSKALVSWSGTMFEYFMPFLIMKNYPDTLLDVTYKTIINQQKSYCKNKKVPWGISESAFYNFDINLNYQYKAFGIPGIGLKRGLIDELVISPYSTILAMQLDFKDGILNIHRLIKEGLEGRYGFYEAVDYTKERMTKNQKKAIVKCFMIHHEGMSLMALDNILNENILQRRFHNIPRVKSTELLLQEKVPKGIIYDRDQRFQNKQIDSIEYKIVMRKYNTSKTNIPEVHLMSNGNYSIMVSNSGSGYSKKDDISIYRWREDVTNDNKGMFFYIKDIKSKTYWSSTYEPCKNEGESYEVNFSLDKAEFKRKDGDIITDTELTVSNEDNSEIRRISLTNHSNVSKIIEITSYCEVTLSSHNADLIHPVFNNLFIRTEFIENISSIIANRRPRINETKNAWCMQTVSVEGETIGSLQYETNRGNFIGRCRDLSNPQVMENDTPLQNTVGAVLDPIISIRTRVKIAPGETSKISYTTAFGSSREEVIELAKKYRQKQNVDRIFDLSWTVNQLEMKYLGIKSSQANLYQLMASRILFLNDSFKDREKYIKNIKVGQSALWNYGISGDLPILLLLINDDKNLDVVKRLLKAHEYWSIKGLKVDFVILNTKSNSYMQNLQNNINDLICSSHARDKQNKNGGVFLINKNIMESEHIDLLMAISRLVINADEGNLIEQIKEKDEIVNQEKEIVNNNKVTLYKPYKFFLPELEYFNDFGGFNVKNNEYVITLNNYNNTPAPWINVISNENFGFHVSEAGIAYTWYKNSRENKITNWSNDPVIDDEAEQIYVRDEETGDIWSISPKPIRDQGEYIIQHGFGYSIFKHYAYGIIGKLTMFVPLNESVKICLVKLKNNTELNRKLSITYYSKIVLGVVSEQTAQHISSYLNKDKKYIYSKNLYNEHFRNFIAYLKCYGGKEESFTGNRKEFLGRGGNLNKPKALTKEKLSNVCGCGFDPCLAVNTKIDLKPNEEKYAIFMLGEDENIENIDNTLRKYEKLDNVFKELDNVKEYWKELLQSIQVKTPDKSMDIMLNGWLMYQVISCRLWARTAFYQSGGAYGFRDQLQDVMSICYLNPKVTREHIIYSASRQFLEGDVQHWWHPVVESGIRTKFSDDLLWLPYVVVDYINNTGDYSILDEYSFYMEDKPLDENEDERYSISKVSDKKGTIYEHCIKAIDRSLRFGKHNIPLMGSGDWNDGMNTVGNKGKGESVWVGWFLYSILNGFSHICRFKNEEDRANKYENQKNFIKENLEKNAWDGNWYRRAYFDNGTPLGSIENEECQIDSLSQSWSVISGAAKEERCKEAMESLEKYLIKRDKGIALLLTPAFDKSSLKPGYIKGYVPGVRENGGQYTHAAIWIIIAFCKMGYGNKAWEIFNMINPINHSKSYLECERYKLEPYVMSADVYEREPHTGRGGWSWYTGSAGWMYKSGIENILGFKFKGKEGFTIEPCIPDNWNKYYIYYKRNKCKYNIKIIRGKKKEILINDVSLKDNIIPYFEEGEYNIKVIIK